MPGPEAYRLPARQALRLIRQDKLTVEGYARSLLSRIDARDATVQAWAYLNRDAVLDQARQLDRIPPEQRGPLHGLPIGVKDIFYTKDMPTEHNSPIYKDSHVPIDSGPVAILRAAGALIFGKTTTTEFASTTIGPVTRNPHDPTRTPGGSSSGSGAAVADYQIPLALGTQTGGSIIRPGSFNGVYALKPTWNAISREGQKISSLVLDTIGFFARRVEDLELVGGVFGLRDHDNMALPDGDGFSLSGARFGLVRTPNWHLAGAGTVSALESARAVLERYGAVVEEVDHCLPAEFDNMPAWHATIVAAEAGVAFYPEYCMDKSKLHPLLVGHVESNLKTHSRAEILAALDGVALLRPRVDEIAGRYAALLAPSVPDEAPVGIEYTGNAAFNGMWTALHTPVVNMPGFKGPNGMPVGVSLVAPRYRDQHLIRVARAVGEVFEAEGNWKSEL